MFRLREIPADGLKNNSFTKSFRTKRMMAVKPRLLSLVSGHHLVHDPRQPAGPVQADVRVQPEVITALAQ